MPSKAETVALALLGLLLVLAVSDLIHALTGQDCGHGAPPDCYPWHAEGPVAGTWDYASQAHYIMAAWVGIVALVLGMLPPFVREGTWLNIALMLLISQGGRIFGTELLAAFVP